MNSEKKMHKLIYRSATGTDACGVAKLHADSWRSNYRGMLNEAYLNGDIDTERRDVWTRRIKDPPENQQVIVGERAGNIVGFVCVYKDADSRWGALVDNLHVHRDHSGAGIGTQLLFLASAWLAEAGVATGVYLWVMEKNNHARRFYEKLGAINQEVVIKTDLPGDSVASNCRYVWETPQALLDHVLAKRGSEDHPPPDSDTLNSIVGHLIASSNHIRVRVWSMR